MPVASFKGIQVSGLACAVPTWISRNTDFGNEYVKKFIETTGVEEARLTKQKQTASDLCYEAAEKLIAYKGYEKDSIDGLVFITQSQDYSIPATAHILQYRLGLSRDCEVFDINLGCSGFVYGLNIVASLVQAGSLNRVLMCCGEAHSIYKSPPADGHAAETAPKHQPLLFGDAGSAVIVERIESDDHEQDEIHTLMKADGSGYQAIIIPGICARTETDPRHLDLSKIGLHMDNAAVFEFSLSRVPKAFKEFFRTFGGGIDDYDYCVFHQANLFMLEHLRKKIKLPKEKMPVSMDRYGNTSSASIPITIADLCQRTEVKDKIRFITCGFGVGLSWGIADFYMDKKDILPIIETDEYFKEAFRVCTGG